MGLLLDWLVFDMNYTVKVNVAEVGNTLPEIIRWASAVLLLLLAIPKIRKLLFRI